MLGTGLTRPLVGKIPSRRDADIQGNAARPLRNRGSSMCHNPLKINRKLTTWRNAQAVQKRRGSEPCQVQAQDMAESLANPHQNLGRKEITQQSGDPQQNKTHHLFVRIIGVNPGSGNEVSNQFPQHPGNKSASRTKAAVHWVRIGSIGMMAV